MSLFQSEKSFVEFHQEEDYGDYLEIKEDRERYRLQNAQELISNFYKKNGIIDVDVDGKSLRIQHEMPYSSLQRYR